MDDNFVALVPAFKFIAEPTLLVSGDGRGLSWLAERFEFLASKTDSAEFVIGDGGVFSSDDRCLVRVRLDERSLIRRQSERQYIWNIERLGAQEVSEKIAALVETNVAGHQYIEIGFGECRTVVITKFEYPISVLRSMRDGVVP